jgi:hypothetical protein
MTDSGTGSVDGVEREEVVTCIRTRGKGLIESREEVRGFRFGRSETSSWDG